MSVTLIVGYLVANALGAPAAQPSVLARIRLPMGSATIIGHRGGDPDQGISDRELVFRSGAPKLQRQVIQLPPPEPGGQANHLWYLALEPRGRPYLVADLALGDTSGGQTTVAEVFAVTSKGLRLLGKLHSNQEIRRLQRPGGGDVLVRSYEIGRTLGHAYMPRWEELFEVRNGALHHLTHDVKWFYTPWIAELRGVLKEHPDDLDIWAHYGLSLQYAGVHRRPSVELKRLKRDLIRSGRAEQAGHIPAFDVWPQPENIGPSDGDY